MILLLKALIPGGASSDLFASPVDVHGYTTKHGTYVAPHRGVRLKRREQPGQNDLFARPESKPAELTPEQRKLAELLRAARKTFAQEGAHNDPEAVAALDGFLKDPANIDAAAAKKVIHEASDRWLARVQAEGKESAAAKHREAAAAPDALGDLGLAAETIQPSKPSVAVPAELPSFKIGDAVAYESFGKEIKGVVVGVSGDHLSVTLSGSGATASVPAADATKTGAGVPIRGNGGEALRSAVNRFKDGSPHWYVADQLLHQLTSGNAKIATSVMAYLEEAPAAKVWKLVDHLATNVAEFHNGGDVRAEAARFVRGNAKKAPAVAAAGEKAPENITGNITAPSVEAKIAEWGVPAGATKAERRKFNAAAIALLKAKTDEEMTDEDRQKLARYTGRGGVGDSLNEFYTDPAVSAAMWTMLGNLGFAGGDVLEPSAGTGVFLHTAPAGTRVTGVELDPTAGRIAGILHRPAGHEVNVASLERFATQDGRQFDAVIGNVPFGLRGGLIKDDKPDLTTAEGYFVDTSLDKTKDGGLVALIVPTGFMDSRNGRAVRERVLTKGEFLGAHRLPNTAFEASHTGVTSDVVLFRKRPADAAAALGTVDQDTLKALGVWDPEFLSGSYFTEGRGAGNVLGTMEEGWRAKAGMGNDITVTGSMAGVPAALADWHPPASPAPVTVERVLEALGDDTAAKRRAVNAALKPAYQVAKVGDTRVVDGVRYVLQGQPPRWHRAEDEIPEAVEDAHKIGEMLEDLSEGRAKDPRLVRAQLAEALDEYIRLHGAPSRSKDLRQWLTAPVMRQAAGVGPEEHGRMVEETRRRTARLLGAVSDDGSYSDLVTGRKSDLGTATIDTVATKLALEEGQFTVDQLAAAWGKGTPESVLDHLYASPNYALDADGRAWTTMDAYVSGDLWPKLDAARAMAAHEGITPEAKGKYERQAVVLEEAIAPQSLEDVEIALNSGFIPPEVLTAWIAARHTSTNWDPEPPAVTFDGALYSVGGGKRVWGDNDLLEKFLNRDGVRKDDLPKLERMTADFRTWLLGSDQRDRVEDLYNRTHRGYRAPDFSDAPIAVPGLNPALDVNAYHFSGLRWALAARKGIIAADVGLGKTARGLMLAKLAKVTGQAKKPTFVVPKSVLANWMREAEFWFPGSKVLVIGETYSTDKAGNITSKPDNAATRQQKYHQLQQNDYDFVFISQPAWNDLDVDPITKGQYVNDEFWTKRGDALGNTGDKRLNQIRTAYDQAMAQREFSKREGTIYFNDLGIDMLLLDEMHAFKNLYSAKNRFGESPKFLGGSGLSNRALDTNFKTKFLRDSNGGNGVFGLTATPTKNSPLEVYSMLSHIAPEAFERMGIKNSEDFLDRFCEFKLDNVLTTSGVIEEALITSGFKNLGELREVMKRYIDRKTAEDVGLVIPAADNRQHMVDMTREQEGVYQELRAAAAEKTGGDAEGDAHIFSIMDKMGKASMDLTLLGMADTGSPKVQACVANVIEGAKEGGQIVFVEHVAMHTRIADALVAAGMPRGRIGIINGQAATTSAARQKISDDFNAGKLDVVIGNKTMEEGVNLQKRTTDMHHLDLPWEPAALQQRNGRGRRQGNKRESIRIHSYLAKGSFDGYRWQTIAAKRDWQDLLWNGGDRVENMAREGAFSREDMMIMLSANPAEARAKYEADRTAAEERQTLEQRSKVVDMFGKFQEMKRSLGALKAKGTGGAAADRLEQKTQRLRTLLQDNRHFTHKPLLDSDEPALIEPTTGFAWHKGAGMQISGGDDAPIKDPGKYVVLSVDPDAKTIRVRRYGSMTRYPVSLSLSDLQSGVTPVEHSDAGEAKEMEEAAARAAEIAGAANAKRLESTTNISDLKQMPTAMVERLAPILQQQIKEAIRSYKEPGYREAYGMLDPSGKPVAVPSYDARKHIDTHDLLLPTAEHRRKAIDAYVDASMNRKVKTHYQETGRRGSRSKESGVQAAYPRDGFEHATSTTHPWDGVLKDVFGPEAVTEAHAEVNRRVTENIEAAPTFRDALVAALPAVDVPTYGRTLTARDWPKATVQQLYAKAKSLGVLDQTVEAVAKPSPSYDHKGDLHPGVLKTTQANYAPLPEAHGTVGRFLLSLLHDASDVTEARGEA